MLSFQVRNGNPVLHGHDTTRKNDSFTTLDEAVDDFIGTYNVNYGQEAAAIYAFSMGGVFAAKIVESGRIRIGKMSLESSPLLPFGPFVGKILCKQYLRLTHLVQLSYSTFLRTIV